MRRSGYWFVVATFLPVSLCAAGTQLTATRESLPLVFEPNRGQSEPQVKFVSRQSHYTLYLAPDRAEFLAADGTRLRMRLEGSDPRARLEGAEKLPGKSFYYYGRDPRHWLTDVPHYAQVRYRGVYPGVGLVFRGSDGQIEYDLVIAPQANVSRVCLAFDGARKLALESNGDLRIETRGGTFRHKKPAIYQEKDGRRHAIAGRYVVEGTRVRFAVEGYDPSAQLVIDPAIVYATYFGGSANDYPGRLATDSSGNFYFTGTTNSADFPLAPTSSTNTPHGGTDAFITKLDSSGKNILFSIRLGGSLDDAGRAIAVDPSGNIYLTGSTYSTDFPILNAYQPTNKGSRDAFIVKLNSSGAVVYSTYLGGSARQRSGMPADDHGYGIAADSQGNAYVTGESRSTDFPATITGLTNSPNWGEAFVAGFGPTGALLFSSLIGGSDADTGDAIAVDSSGAVWVGGGTQSMNMPVTAGVIQNSFGGGSLGGDAWIAKINPLGSSSNFLLALTYLGGMRDEELAAVKTDSSGNIYLTGTTYSPNFPTTAGAYQTTQIKSEGGDMWVAKLNSTLTAKVFATYVSWSDSEQAGGIALDSEGNVWVGGWTRTAYLTPAFLSTTTDTLQAGYGGGDGDAFLLELNPSGTTALYFSYIGGSKSDSPFDLAYDGAGNMYLLLRTESTNMPLSQAALQTSLAGGVDAFLLKLALTPRITAAGICNSASYVCGKVAAGEIVTIWGASFGSPGLVGMQVANGFVTTTLDNTKIYFDGTTAPMIYVTGGAASVLSCVVPYSVAGKSSTQVQVEFKGRKSAAVAVPVVDAVPGVFSMNQSGTGPGAILNWPDYTVNSSSNRVAAGGYAMVFATGEGRTDIALDGQIVPLAGPYPQPVVGPWTATVGGKNAPVVWTGSAPQSVAGLFQINVQIPPDLTAGTYELVIKSGSFASQAGLTIAVK